MCDCNREGLTHGAVVRSWRTSTAGAKMVTYDCSGGRQDSIFCPYYWLKRYLEDEFPGQGVTPENVAAMAVRGDFKKRTRLFRWNPDELSMKVNTRATMTGYPHNMMSFHSFRSGFICQAVAKAGDDPRGAMERTALVAGGCCCDVVVALGQPLMDCVCTGWAVGSRAQRGYVTFLEKRLVLANNVTSSIGPSIDVAMVDDPIMLHDLDEPLKLDGSGFKDVNTKTKAGVQNLLRRFTATYVKKYHPSIDYDTLSGGHQEGLKESFRCWLDSGKKHRLTIKEAQEMWKADNSLDKQQLRDRLDALANKYFKKRSQKAISNTLANPKWNRGPAKTTRTPFTEEQDAIIVAAVDEFLSSVADVSPKPKIPWVSFVRKHKQHLPGRSAATIKSRYKTLMKHKEEKDRREQELNSQHDQPAEQQQEQPSYKWGSGPISGRVRDQERQRMYQHDEPPQQQSSTGSSAMGADMCVLVPPVPPAPVITSATQLRRDGQAFSEEENDALLAGYEKHKHKRNVWALIKKEYHPLFSLRTSRTCLRDRYKNIMKERAEELLQSKSSSTTTNTASTKKKTKNKKRPANISSGTSKAKRLRTGSSTTSSTTASTTTTSSSTTTTTTTATNDSRCTWGVKCVSKDAAGNYHKCPCGCRVHATCVYEYTGLEGEDICQWCAADRGLLR